MNELVFSKNVYTLQTSLNKFERYHKHRRGSILSFVMWMSVILLKPIKNLQISILHQATVLENPNIFYIKSLCRAKCIFMSAHT